MEKGSIYENSRPLSMVCVQRKKLSVYERNKVPFIFLQLVIPATGVGNPR